MDIDLAFILDSSEATTLFQFNEMKKYIGYVIRQLDLSPDPKASQHFARVAVVQQSTYESVDNASEGGILTDRLWCQGKAVGFP